MTLLNGKPFTHEKLKTVGIYVPYISQNFFDCASRCGYYVKAIKQFHLVYLMGENIGCRAVMLRPIGSQCIGVCISTGLLCIRKYTL
jgi:hypothetical protein